MVSPAAILRALVVAALAAVLAFAPANARAQRMVTVTVTVNWTHAAEGDVDADDEGVGAIDGFESPSDDEALADEADAGATRRYAPASLRAAPDRVGTNFGPVTVVDDRTIRMAGDVTSATPRQFATMMAAFPRLRRLEMIDCPGSLDEEANLILARAIRRAGLETIVPSGGSVRSGAVELWLAGTTRRAADDAEFGVHRWLDDTGREANDYPADDPVHAEYLGYYREMGMNDAQARAFYALTNATPFDEVHYLTRDDMARFVRLN